MKVKAEERIRHDHEKQDLESKERPKDDWTHEDTDVKVKRDATAIIWFMRTCIHTAP